MRPEKRKATYFFRKGTKHCAKRKAKKIGRRLERRLLKKEEI